MVFYVFLRRKATQVKRRVSLEQQLANKRGSSSRGTGKQKLSVEDKKDLVNLQIVLRVGGSADKSPPAASSGTLGGIKEKRT